MDATCCPAEHFLPQELSAFDEAREKLEHIVDVYCEAYKLEKPRMRRRTAHRDYLQLSKCKKRTAQKLREGVRKQLQYIRRDIGFIVDIIRKTHLKVEEKVADLLNTITTLYEQQLYMYENRVHTVPDRIVSISQPWVRPIVRGKAHANTEFGAKLHISLVDGYAKIERLSFDAYNEATDFFSAVEGYRQEHGCYPQRILVDKIYRNRETISWCKAQGIQLTGPSLGRPAKNAERTKQAKKQEYQDICDRNIVEGEFGSWQAQLWAQSHHGTPAGNFLLCHRHCFAVHEPGKETAVSFAPIFAILVSSRSQPCFRILGGLRSGL